MKNLTLENITKVCGGVYFGPADKLDQEVSSITTDSRKIEAGSLFVPIVGERVDAHKFIPQVMEAGALATLSERTLENADFPYIKVESSLQAVKDIAEFYLKQGFLESIVCEFHRKKVEMIMQAETKGEIKFRPSIKFYKSLHSFIK